MRNPMMKNILFVVLNLVLTVVLQAQIPPDRDILLKGEGAGQGSFAELNGYPGPKHVLEHADALKLTSAERAAVKALYEDMLSRARELGKTIIKIEEELNNAFKDKLVVMQSVKNDAEQIGRLRGRLRAVHLGAHLKTKALLSQKQLDTYYRLRKKPGTGTAD